MKSGSRPSRRIKRLVTPSGRRTPRSQAVTLWALTPTMSAKRAWETFKALRVALISAGLRGVRDTTLDRRGSLLETSARVVSVGAIASEITFELEDRWVGLGMMSPL